MKWIAPKQQLTPEHYWVAGFLEGEGSFGVTGGLILQITVSQKQRQPLDRLQSTIGGNINRIYWQGRKYWRLTLCGNHKVEPWLILLRPLMSPRRQWQFDMALSKRVITDPRDRGGNRKKKTCPRGHPYDIHKIEKDGTPHRKCSICLRDASRRRYAAKKTGT